MQSCDSSTWFVPIEEKGRVIGGLALVDIVIRAAELVLTTLLALKREKWRCPV